MKKTYITPAIEAEAYAMQSMIAASIKGIGGVNDITIAGEDTEGLDADVKGIW